MEIRQKLVNVPARPIALLVALLCAVVIALAGWYALAASIPASSSTETATSTGGFPGPDARERNAQYAQVGESSEPEPTHGH